MLCCAVLSHSVVSNSLQSHGLQLARLLCPWGFSRQEYWSGLPCSPPGAVLNSGLELRYPTLQANSLPSEPPGKPKNTGVGGLSFLQGIFLIQELNWGLLHCRWILNQLTYQGSLGVVTKEISKQSVENTTWFLLAAYNKIQDERVNQREDL